MLAGSLLHLVVWGIYAFAGPMRRAVRLELGIPKEASTVRLPVGASSCHAGRAITTTSRSRVIRTYAARHERPDNSQSCAQITFGGMLLLFAAARRHKTNIKIRALRRLHLLFLTLTFIAPLADFLNTQGVLINRGVREFGKCLGVYLLLR